LRLANWKIGRKFRGGVVGKGLRKRKILRIIGWENKLSIEWGKGKLLKKSKKEIMTKLSQISPGKNPWKCHWWHDPEKALS
jgi:hypothetical protein